ncbi:hypothetical protein PD374_17725 [Pseudomonas sp. WCS374]|nr:hypothetical protein PD374_17725 [Pseudomonas sp. WCS374]
MFQRDEMMDKKIIHHESVNEKLAHATAQLKRFKCATHSEQENSGSSQFAHSHFPRGFGKTLRVSLEKASAGKSPLKDHSLFLCFVTGAEFCAES